MRFFTDSARILTSLYSVPHNPASHLTSKVGPMSNLHTEDGTSRHAGTHEHATMIVASLESAELPIEEVGENRWMTVLAGEYKRTIPVLIHLDERSLKVTSLFTGVPDEGHERVYRLLLQKNQRHVPVHFALDDAGNIVLVGQVRRCGLDAASFESLLGVVLTMADEAFNQVLRMGFAGYLEDEQRWRERAGLPPNPVGWPLPVEDDV